MSVRTGPTRSGPRWWLVTPTLLATQVLVMLEGTVVNVSLVRIRAEYGLDDTALSWVLVSYLLAFGSGMLAGGRLTDAFGARRVLVVAVGVFGLASLLCGLATGPATLLSGRALQGLAAAATVPGLLAVIAELAPDPARRNRAVARLTGAGLVGGGIGLTAGGLLVEWLGTRWVFLVNLPLCAALLPCLLALPGLRGPAGERPRLGVGQVVLPGAALAMLLGAVGLSGEAVPWPVLTGLVAGGLLSAVAAVLVVRRAGADSVLPLGLLAGRGRPTAYALSALVFGSTHTAFIHLQLVVQRDWGLGPAATGLVFTPVIVVMVLTTAATPRLLRRVPDRVLVPAGCLLAAAGMVWAAVALAPPSTGAADPLLLVPMAMLATGSALCMVPLAVRAVDGIPPGRTGVASAVLTCAQQIGGAVLITLVGLLSGVRPYQALVVLLTVGAVLGVLGLRRDPARVEPPEPAPPTLGVHP
ncbi:MFS transporter [Pseudonocardia sp. WMMC193]|uniref:MFS transporter n=1 Tax=Pseudonocardia sp. WMMC193 TaxID=2911965 RepID=UPI001F2D4854|nr:MFS transporter [Pseudonocardia sp. WMMC193]MCF7550009.1 MFS transporter [Pseudonocardia sp. WMMC193]